MKPPGPEATIVQAPAYTRPSVIARFRGFVKMAWRLQEREKSRLREEIAHVPGLMALLMKPRNGQKWTRAERAELRAQFRRLSRLGLYLTTAALPGTSLTLPLLAWWLDRRQRKRLESSSGAKSP
jgi:hypothetical protein